MFHQTRLLEAQQRISNDLKYIDDIGSVKLYLCFYDDLLVSEEEWNGKYPCCDKKVSLYEILSIIKLVFNKPCIIRHNILLSPFPVGLSAEQSEQPEIEKYVEVCIIKNVCLQD
jgi:hypothetical protein